MQNEKFDKDTQLLVDVVTDYAFALDTLDDYDHQRLVLRKSTAAEKFHATYENAMAAIQGLKEKFGGSELFGHEKDESFKSSIGQIYQTFGGEELYPSVEQKAAMLLYLVTKLGSLFKFLSLDCLLKLKIQPLYLIFKLDFRSRGTRKLSCMGCSAVYPLYRRKKFLIEYIVTLRAAYLSGLCYILEAAAAERTSFSGNLWRIAVHKAAE